MLGGSLMMCALHRAEFTWICAQRRAILPILNMSSNVTDETNYPDYLMDNMEIICRTVARNSPGRWTMILFDAGL